MYNNNHDANDVSPAVALVQSYHQALNEVHRIVSNTLAHFTKKVR